MAFMGRGDFSSIGNNNAQGNNIGWHRHYGRICYYVPLDNTYMIMQMVATFIIVIVGMITLFFTDKSTIIDPIENTKKLFINSYLIIIGVLLALTLLTNFFSKSETSLIKILTIISMLSLTIMVVFFGIKLNFDTNYTKEKFEQFYTEQNINKVTNVKYEISIQGEKEHYIDECLKSYDVFSTRAYGVFGIHLLLNVLIIYRIAKVLREKAKKARLEKDDLILYDEEENIRM